MIEAVVLDLGNVIIGWDPHPAIAAGVGTVEATRFLTATDFDFWGWNHLLDSGVPLAEAEQLVARTHPHWHKHAVAYRENFEQSLVSVIEGSVRVVETLAANAVPVYGLTNWSGELFPVARRRFGFLSLFTDIVVSGEEGCAKPDPEIFEILADRVGIPLTRCAFADDRVDNVEAGRRAGLDAFVFTDPPQLRDELVTRGLL